LPAPRRGNEIASINIANGAVSHWTSQPDRPKLPASATAGARSQLAVRIDEIFAVHQRRQIGAISDAEEKIEDGVGEHHSIELRHPERAKNRGERIVPSRMVRPMSLASHDRAAADSNRPIRRRTD